MLVAQRSMDGERLCCCPGETVWTQEGVCVCARRVMKSVVLIVTLLIAVNGIPQGIHNGYSIAEYSSGLLGVRGLLVDEGGALLALSYGNVYKVCIHYSLFCSHSLYGGNAAKLRDGGVQLRLLSLQGLNHGIAYYDGYLYCSTPTTVYRWPYNASAPDGAITTPAQAVITDMPPTGHVTRTLVFDAQGYLYVNIGSGTNVDATDWRSRVVRFSPAQYGGSTSVSWTSGQVFARGTRNEVALCFDDLGRLWGVENGVDDLTRADLGGDIHNENPGEEINLVSVCALCPIFFLTGGCVV